jgi:predicted RNA binding protein YcfA (HicA-like mRNA interferase family)
MKSSELLRLLQKDGCYTVSQKGSYIKMKHPFKSGVLIVPNHGSNEVGKGLEMILKKDAGI